MKFLSKVGLGTLACVLIVSGIGIINPSAVHAVVATIIRDQDNPARHPFTAQCTVIAAAGFNFGECNAPAAIPPGEEVVIETISIAGSSDANNNVLQIALFVTTSGITNEYDLNPLFDSGLFQPGGSTFRGVQSLRVYADPGTPIPCHGTIAPGTASLSFVCKISGYFVTLP